MLLGQGLVPEPQVGQLPVEVPAAGVVGPGAEQDVAVEQERVAAVDLRGAGQAAGRRSSHEGSRTPAGATPRKQ